MLQYLIILLDDTSVSYCHYENPQTGRKLIPLETLRKGILFGMKENLMIQFVYPDYELPDSYKGVIESIDHSNIMPADKADNADVVVLNGWKHFYAYTFDKEKAYVWRISKDDFFCHYGMLKEALKRVSRLNVVITDIETFVEDDFLTYKKVLNELVSVMGELYIENQPSQLNLLTDRMMLDKMNNCNAGWENITLAPDGKFYICPAFYLAEEDDDFGLGRAKFSVGDLEQGLDIKNPQLYRLDYAPLCRKCDAYQCKRCVWLNRKMTYEVNTPSHEQCVVAHLERNASRKLLENIRKHGIFLPEQEIKKINYLDPFDVRKEW